MAKYEISNTILNNLLLFLDRVTITGRNEYIAYGEILNVLNNPVVDEDNEVNDK